MRLRPLKESDISEIIHWIPGNERDFTMWSVGKILFPPTKADLLSFYKSREADEKAWFMTALNDSGEPVGCFMMREADYENNSIHLGFIIVDRRRKIKGLGKEMLSLAIRYSFEVLKMSRVTLTVFPINEPALRCYESVGLKAYALREKDFDFKGEKWDRTDMSIERNT